MLSLSPNRTPCQGLPKKRVTPAVSPPANPNNSSGQIDPKNSKNCNVSSNPSSTHHHRPIVPLFSASSSTAATVDPLDVPQIHTVAIINGVPANVLVDGGCTRNLMSHSFQQHHDFTEEPIADTELLFANGNHSSTNTAVTARMQMSSPPLDNTVTFTTAPIEPDVILGRHFLASNNVVVHHATSTLAVPDKEPRQTPHHETTTTTTRQAKISLISASALGKAIKKHRAHCFLIMIRPNISTFDEIIPEPEEPQNIEASTTELQRILDDYSDVFRDALPKELPPDRGVNHRIPTKEGHKPYARSPYRLSPEERSELRKQLTDLIDAGKIRPSSSPYGAPVLFVRKSDGTLRLCVDYRMLNRDTIKDKYPLPNMQDVIDQLQGAKVFSTIDLRSGYWQIKIAPEDVHKTAFNTVFGSYEFLVMPFGLTSAPSTFQRAVNSIFGEAQGKFVLTYLDDFIVFSNTFEEHERHLRFVLDKLREHQLYAKLSKCEFFKDSVAFLGHVVTVNGVKMDPRKIEAITKWKYPSNVSELRSFLGFVNFYRRFIKDFAKHAHPLSILLRKDQPWLFGEEQVAAFEFLRTKVVSDPILRLPDFTKTFTLQTDASDYAIGGVLLQDGRTVAYESRALRDAETRYDIRDKEALAIIHCLLAWRHYLQGSTFFIETDHHSLQFLQTQSKLKPRHARWMELIGSFGELDLRYKPGKSNVVADALSRLPSDNQPPDHDVHQVIPVIASVSAADPSKSSTLTAIRKHTTIPEPLPSDKYTVKDGLLLFQDRIVVPDLPAVKTQLIKECHDPIIRGHRAAAQTYLHLRQHFYWRKMHSDVQSYVSSCPSCQRNKYPTTAPQGLLNPLPIPDRKWDSVSMDFIKMPTSKRKNNTVFVVVDRLSKYTELIPTVTNANAQQTARLFFDNVVSRHGLPISIVSDRDGRFISKFWTELFRITGTSLDMSSGYHPETDGQTERQNKVLRESLRAYSNYNQDDWDIHLPALQFSINSSTSASTGFSPFQLQTGQQPRSPLDVITHTLDSSVPAAKDFLMDIKASIGAAKDNIHSAQLKMSQQANKRRRPHAFSIGDMVLVSSADLMDPVQRQRPNAKLKPLYSGPYKIIDSVHKTSFKLQLPPNIKVHPVFHASKLRPFTQTPPEHASRKDPPPPPDIINNEPEYEVEQILDARPRANPREYLVKWKGYDHCDNTWEPLSNLQHAKEAISDYHRRR